MSDNAMPWEQKFAAIQALGGHFGPCLRMRLPGNWYVADDRVEIGGNGLLTGTTESEATPQLAVETHFRSLTELEPGQYLVLHAGTKKRKHVRWNGHMWQDLGYKPNES